MAFIKFSKSYETNYNTVLNGFRSFTSSSVSGVTGSVFVFVNRSDTQKDSIDLREGLGGTGPNGEALIQPFHVNTFERRRQEIYQGNVGIGKTGATNHETALALLLDGASAYESQANWPPEISPGIQLNLNFAHKGYSDFGMHPRNATKKDIRKLSPSNSLFSSASMIYKNMFDDANDISAQNCLNEYIDNAHVLNLKQKQFEKHGVFYYNHNNSYNLTSDGITISFWIKPSKFCTGSEGVLHNMHNYSVSIHPVTFDEDGYSDKLEIVTQLGSSMLLPEKVSLGTHGYRSTGYVTAGEWTNYLFKWAPDQNLGQPVVQLNYVREENQFTPVTSVTTAASNALVIGGFFTGNTTDQSRIFGQNATTQGRNFTGFSGDGYDIDSILGYCLNAELHEIKIQTGARTNEYTADRYTTHTGSLDNYKFYLPLLFNSSGPAVYSNILKNSDNQISVSNNNADFWNIDTTWAARSGSYVTNINHAHIGGFGNINIANFLKDYKTDKYPYLHMLSESEARTIYKNCQAFTSSYFVDNSLRNKRNLTILPSDNFDFTFNATPFLSGTVNSGSYYKEDVDKIKILDIAIQDEFNSKYMLSDEVYADVKKIFSPGNPTVSTSEILARADFFTTWFNYATKFDTANNTFIMITIPQIFYGERIKPGSVIIRGKPYDDEYTIKLVDDISGAFYRSDSSNPAKRYQVGKIDYSKGLIVISNPTLYNIFDYEFYIEFRGENQVFVKEYNLPVQRGLFTSSSNPNYQSLRPSDYVHEEDSSFVYITRVNLHDSNLNVIAKATLAQPIIKQPNDKYLIRLRLDF
jgi:hypothetical protein